MLDLLLQSDALPRAALERNLALVVPAPASHLIARILDETGGSAHPFAISFAFVFLWWSATKGMMGAMAGLNAVLQAARAQRDG